MPEDTLENAPMRAAAALSRAGRRHPAATILATVVLAVLLVIALRWLTSPAPQPPEHLPPDTFRPTAEQLAGLSIKPVIAGANVELVRASGSIAVDADHSTPILLPFSGQVTRVLVEQGQQVSRDQPLMEIASADVIDARNAQLAASAQVAAASQAAHLAERNLARQKAIYETAGGALKDYLQSQSDAVAAKSALRVAQAALAASRSKLAFFGQAAPSSLNAGGMQVHTIYRAPVSGTVADRAVAPGQFVTSGGSAPLMTIADLSQVWLVAQLAESDAVRVNVGDEVTVTTPAFPGKEFKARIDNVGASLDPVTHRLPVRATISNPSGLLKPQMFASFVIRRTLGGGSGVLVPSSAVIHEGDSARVWTATPDGLLHARNIEIAETEGGLTRVTRGLSPGERVVVTGALFVNEAGLDQ